MKIDKYSRVPISSFSLLEILIALAVMLVGIVGVASLFPVGLRSSRVSEDLSIVTMLAQRKLEEIKLAGYTEISEAVLGVGNGDNQVPIPPPYSDYPSSNYQNFRDGPDWSDPAGDGNIEYSNYDWKMRVEDVASSSPWTPRRMTITVHWMDRGIDRTEDFITYVAKYN